MSGDTLPVSPPPSIDPIPQLQVTPQPAAGKKGPTGVSPRTNYSKVNTGQPPPSALPAAPSSLETPKLGYAMTLTTPTVAQLKLAAMQGGLQQAKLAEEASRHASDCNCEGCCKKRDEAKKEASQHKVAFDSAYCRDLAQVGVQVAAQLRKEASANPSGIPESTASASGKLPPSFGHSPQAPSLKPSTSAKPAMGAPQGGVVEESHTMGSEGKRASANPSGLPESTGPQDAGQPIGGKPPSGPEALINSNQAAIDATQRDAYANRKAEVAKWLTEKPLSAATDTTLRSAFTHGVETSKISADKANFLSGLADKAKSFGRSLAGRGAHGAEDIAKMEKHRDASGPLGKGLATKKLEEMAAANKTKQVEAGKTLGAAAGATALGGGGIALGAHMMGKKKDQGEEHTAADLSIKTASATVLLEQLEKEARNGR